MFRRIHPRSYEHFSLFTLYIATKNLCFGQYYLSWKLWILSSFSLHPVYCDEKKNKSRRSYISWRACFIKIICIMYFVGTKKITNIGICEKARTNSLKEIPWFSSRKYLSRFVSPTGSFYSRTCFTFMCFMCFTDAFQREQHQKAFVTVIEISFSLGIPFSNCEIFFNRASAYLITSRLAIAAATYRN